MRSSALGPLLVALGMVVCFSCNGYALQGSTGIQPELSQVVLRMLGFETEIIELDQDGLCNRALYLEDLRGNGLLIGFPEAGITMGRPFSLEVDGRERMVALSGGGSLGVISGNEELVPTGVLDFVNCILSNLGDLIRDVLECGATPLCILRAVLTAVFNILTCLGELF